MRKQTIKYWTETDDIFTILWGYWIIFFYSKGHVNIYLWKSSKLDKPTINVFESRSGKIILQRERGGKKKKPRAYK